MYSVHKFFDGDDVSPSLLYAHPIVCESMRILTFLSFYFKESLVCSITLQNGYLLHLCSLNDISASLDT